MKKWGRRRRFEEEGEGERKGEKRGKRAPLLLIK